MLVIGHRHYDGAGRVEFEAEPYLKSSNAHHAFGTSYHYKNTGDIHCIVQGRGAQPLVQTTSLQPERFPTCYDRLFDGNAEIVEVRDAASLLPGSPQADVIHRFASTATGSVIEHSIFRNGVRVDLATFAHDRLGQMRSMSRYLNPVNATVPVVWNWRVNSLGNVLELQEPALPIRYHNYSDWDELTEVRWRAGSSDYRTIIRYDSLGRVIGGFEQLNGVVDPETDVSYSYDQSANLSPLLSPSFVKGRLASASSPGRRVEFSYSPLGQINGQIFLDTSNNETYAVRAEVQADQSLASLEYLLPDAGHQRELFKYHHDVMGRLRSISYSGPAGSRELYRAFDISPWGEVLKARYGDALTYAANYPDGDRRLLSEALLETPSEHRRIAFLSYDPLGRELIREESRTNAQPVRTTTTYDALGRMASASATSAGTSLSSWVFAYDTLGNVRKLTDLVGDADASMTYDSADLDRICRVGYGNSGVSPGACDVSFNALGSITAQPVRAGSRELDYFLSGAVKSIRQQGAEARFAYDSFGAVQSLRVEGSTVEPRLEQRFGGLIETRTVQRNGLPQSLTFRNVPGPGGTSFTKRGKGDDWVFEFGEMRGNRFFADAAGNFIQGVDYAPFGEARLSGSAPGSPDYTSFQWNGGDALSTFGLTQLGERLYDPVTARFLARDSMVIPRTAGMSNPYAFSGNDPLNRADPSGASCIGAECMIWMQPMASFGSGGSANGSQSEASPAVPPQLQAPTPTGPRTSKGQALRMVALSIYGSKFPRDFNFDTLAQGSRHLSDTLDNLAAAYDQVTDAEVDEYNANLSSWASSAAGVGDALNWPCWIGCSGESLRASLGITSVNESSFQYQFGNIGTTLVTLFGPAFSKFRFNPAKPALPNAVRRCCFVKGTLVSTPDGLRPIETIAKGDLVYSRDEQSGETMAKRVLNRIVREKRECMRSRSRAIRTVKGGQRCSSNVRSSMEDSQSELVCDVRACSWPPARTEGWRIGEGYRRSKRRADQQHLQSGSRRFSHLFRRQRPSSGSTMPVCRGSPSSRTQPLRHSNLTPEALTVGQLRSI